jgi:sporulation protein YlmC with PRC-barrel domain
MLKTLMISAAIGALTVSGALAQANPPAAQSGNQPAAAETTHSPKFIQAQTGNEWAFSKFKGTNVLGPDNTKVGDVTDIIFDKQGKVHGLVVGVGGFLGIGEKNVAIDLSAFEVVPYSTGSNMAGSNTGPGGTAANRNAGATSTTGAATSSGNTAADNDPNYVKLKVSWTKDQLKNAPDFQYYKSAANTRSAAPTTGMAPGGTTPAAPRQ